MAQQAKSGTLGEKGHTGVTPVQDKRKAGVTPVQDKRKAGDTTLHIRRGAYLPHWTREGAKYAVNFRLADSVPQSTICSWLAEREDIIHNAKLRGTPLTPDELQRLDYLHSEKVEKYLHAGRGACWMKDNRIANIVATAITHFDDIRYHLYAWCVMPNHVHVVLQPFKGFSLPTILHSWKSFTAKETNKIICKQGQFWQVEYYDHLIRDTQDLIHAIEYAWSNPDKARLKNWQWRWEIDMFSHERDAQAHERDAHGT